MALLTGKTMGLRLCAVHLVDSHYCSDASNFISVLMLSLSTMMKLELPHVNVLSKIDLVESSGPLDFGLEFYTDVLDLPYLAQHLQDQPNMPPKYAKLNAALTDILEDFSMLSFTPLNIEDKHSVHNVLKVVDKANGYVFSGLEGDNVAAVMGTAAGETDWKYDQAAAYQELYGRCDEYDAAAEEQADAKPPAGPLHPIP